MWQRTASDDGVSSQLIHRQNRNGNDLVAEHLEIEMNNRIWHYRVHVMIRKTQDFLFSSLENSENVGKNKNMDEEIDTAHGS